MGQKRLQIDKEQSPKIFLKSSPIGLELFESFEFFHFLSFFVKMKFGVIESISQTPIRLNSRPQARRSREPREASKAARSFLVNQLAQFAFQQFA